MPEQILMSRKKAAAALDVSVRTVDAYIASGALLVRRIGRRTLIPRLSLEAFARRDHEVSGKKNRQPVMTGASGRATASTQEVRAGV